MKVNELIQTHQVKIVDNAIQFPSIKSKDEYIEYYFMIYKRNEVTKSPRDFVNEVSNDTCVFDKDIWVLQIDYRRDSSGYTTFIRGEEEYIVETFESLYYAVGYTFKHLE